MCIILVGYVILLLKNYLQKYTYFKKLKYVSEYKNKKFEMNYINMLLYFETKTEQIIIFGTQSHTSISFLALSL